MDRTSTSPRELFGSPATHVKPSMHYSGMSNTFDTSPSPAVPVTLDDINLVQVYNQVDGAKLIEEALAPEMHRLFTEKVFNKQSVSILGRLEIEARISSEIDEPLRDMANQLCTDTLGLVSDTVRAFLEQSIQPVLTANLSTILAGADFVSTKEAPTHMMQFGKVVLELSNLATDLDKTKDTVSALGYRKTTLTSQLRKHWTPTSDDDGRNIDDVPTDELSDHEREEKAKHDERMEKCQQEVEEIDKRLTTLGTYSKSIRNSIKGLLAENYNTPDIEWNTEPKQMKTPKLDARLAGTPDPTLAENLIVNIRSLLHTHVSKFWALIPFLECMDENRSHADHWRFPCEANRYADVPPQLLETYKSQSGTLFQQLWSAMNGATQIGSTILRKTFAEKFLGDVLDMEVSVKSSRNDGMMSIFWLITVHESAGYVEKARLKRTIHQSASLFVSGNPQSKLEAIRVIIDKAMTLRVTIDFEATVKPIVMTLRKRSPNFNELAAKYLKQTNFPDWTEQCLHHLDTLLSEIDHTVDTLGMQSNILDLTDTQSKSGEASAKAAFAYYTGAKPRHDGGNQKQHKPKDNKSSSAWKCGAKDCENTVDPEVQRKQQLRRKQSQGGPKKYFKPVICTECMDKLNAGTVQTITLIDGSQRRPITNSDSGNAGARARNAQATNPSNKSPTKSDASDAKEEMKSTMRDILKEALLEMQTAESPEPEPEATTPERTSKQASFVETLLSNLE